MESFRVAKTFENECEGEISKFVETILFHSVNFKVIFIC